MNKIPSDIECVLIDESQIEDANKSSSNGEPPKDLDLDDEGQITMF